MTSFLPLWVNIREHLHKAEEFKELTKEIERLGLAKKQKAEELKELAKACPGRRGARELPEEQKQKAEEQKAEKQKALYGNDEVGLAVCQKAEELRELAKELERRKLVKEFKQAFDSAFLIHTKDK